MYERFYRLRERPFALTPDPDYLYPSRVHQEALNYLRYGIESHAGFVVITGAIGSGKTTLLQTLLRGLDSHTTVARVMNTLLDPRELIEAAMIDVGLDPDGKSKPAMLKQFAEFLVGERSAGRMVLLVIDEAQNLPLASLEELRMLSNMETEKSKLVQIVLIGQPELRDKLDRPELEQLRQRVTVSYHLTALDADETSRYINHRLARASVGTPLEFGHGVTDLIHERAGGVPRLINVIADATLVYGYGEERADIDAALVGEVIKDLDETGVLGRPADTVVRPKPDTAPEPVVRSSVVSPVASGFSRTASAVASGFSRTDSAVASGFSRTSETASGTPPALSRTAEDEIREKAVRERERVLALREQEMAAREREIAEQRRVLSEQYRILRSRPAEPAAAPAPTAAAAASRPAARVATPTRTWPPTQPAGARRTTFKSPRRPRTFWTRVKEALLGVTEPILEDSL